jgi:hypothetical protein
LRRTAWWSWQDSKLQSLAQGACMAIEDGVCLAELIDFSDGDFKSAFRQYEMARYLRTARVQILVALSLGQLLSPRRHRTRSRTPSLGRAHRAGPVSVLGVVIQWVRAAQETARRGIIKPVWSIISRTRGFLPHPRIQRPRAPRRDRGAGSCLAAAATGQPA